MPEIKATFFFEGRIKGWTESYYRPGLNNSHFVHYEEAYALAVKRAQLLGVESEIKAIRISTEGLIGDALLRYVNLKAQPTKTTPAGNAATPPRGTAQPDVALLLRCHDALGQHHKYVYLRGIWDQIENQNGLYTPNADWVAVLDQYIGALVGGQWGWMGVTARNIERLQSAVTDENSLVQFTFQGNIFAGVPLGQRRQIRISGVNDGRSSLNRVHTVQILSATTCRTEFSTAIPATVKGGKGVLNTLGLIDIAGADAQKIVTRECGAPLLESPGRRKGSTRG